MGMTQLEKFVALYREFGIDCVVVSVPSGGSKIILGEGPDQGERTDSEKFHDSYMGFYARIYFDADGNFVSQSFLE